MRWATWIVLGLGAGFGASMAGPVWANVGQFDSSDDYAWLIWISILLVYGVPGLLLTGVLGTAFLRIGLVGERDALMTRIALGERRGDIARAAARDGGRAGLIASAVGVPIGMAITQVTSQVALASSQGFPGEPSVQWGAVAWALAVVAGFTAVGAFTHVIAYTAVTRGTPDAMAAASAAGTEVPRKSAFQGSRWARILRVLPAVTFGFGLAIVALNRAVPLDAWAVTHLSPAGWLMVTKNIGLTLAVLGGVWWGYRAVTWAGERVVRGASAVLGRGDATGGRAFAADGLARPNETRRRVLAITAIVAALWAWAWAANGTSDAQNQAALALDADAIVTSVDPWAGTGLPTGLTRFGLDESAVDQLAANPDLRVIPARVLVEDDASMWIEVPGPVNPSEGEITYQPFALAIDRADADAVAPDAFRRLGLAAGTQLTGRDVEYLRDVTWVEATCCGEGVGTVSTWVGATPVYSVWSQAPMTSVDGEWAREIWGDAPVSALLVFTATPDEQFGMPHDAVISAVNEAFPEGSAYVLTADRYSGWISWSSDGFVWVGLLGAVIVVALASAAAFASVRSRRRELATFAALGASPRSLRAAPVWEALVVTGAAAAVGTAVGVALNIVLGNPFLLTPGAPFDLGEIAWHMGRDIAAVPWAVVLGGAAAVVAVTAAIAWWMARDMASGSPVEELRTADKEGAR